MSDVSAPAYKAVAVTPSDGTPIPTCRALYIGTGGDVTVKVGTDTAVLHKNTASGSVLPVQATFVMATGTTAADIVAWY